MTCTPIGWFKLNVDGAFRSATPISGICRLIRDADSNWTFGFIKSVHANCPIYVELQAIHQGLILAEQNNLTPLEMETNSPDVIRYLKKEFMI